RRHECLCAEALRWLQPGLANGQRDVCDRRPDETSLGLAGVFLLPAFFRVMMGRLEISRPEPAPARRRIADGRQRSRKPVLASHAPPWARAHADRYDAYRLDDRDGAPHDARGRVCGGGIRKRLRLYSSATLMIFFVFGALAGMEAPRVAANLPTPWIGVWERIIIAAQMLWIAVLAVTLLRNQAVWQRTTYAESH